MDKVLLKQKIGKWNDACRFLKGHQADLSTAEWSAVELLADFWRTRKFDAELVEESKELIAALVAADKLHSNNRDIITWSKEFRGIAKTMYTENAANFAEFQAAMRTFARENAPRQSAPRPQPTRPNPQPRQPRPQPRPAPAPPPPRRATMRITEVEFRNVDLKGNQVGSGNVDGSERIYYLRPLVNCQILEPSESKDVWYKIFSPGGQLLVADSGRPGYTWHGVVNGRQDGWATLGHFGSENGISFTERGRYRVEFYENDVKLYEASVLGGGDAVGGTSGGGVARRPQPTANIRITAVDFFETDGGNQVFGRVRDGFTTRLRYVCPEITYTVLRPTADKDVWYKIYKPGGTLLLGSGAREGYTWKGRVNGRTGGTVALGAFGSKDGMTFNEVGWYRVEFYENDVKVFETKYYVAAAPVRPEPILETRPQNRPPRPQPPRRDVAPTLRPRKWRVKVWMIVAVVVVGWYLMERWGPIVATLFIPDTEATDGAAAAGGGETYYVFADELILRSSKVARSATNQRARLPYGTKVEVASVADGWASVVANGQGGYVSPDYLLNEADFQLLEGVFKDAESRQVVGETKERLALLDFLKRKGLNTGEGGATLVGVKDNRYEDDVWKGLLKVNDRVTDCFAFVLTVEGQAERPLAVYNMSVDGGPELLYESVTSEKGGLENVSWGRRGGEWECTIGGCDRQSALSSASGRKAEGKRKAGTLRVNSGSFAETDNDGNVVTPYGGTLYADLQYLTPKLNVTALADWTDSLDYRVKIFRPDGTLERGNTSPAGYTFGRRVGCNVRKGETVDWTLLGWGNANGNAYRAGDYVYEVWVDGERLWRQPFTVRPVGGGS